jgi:hypothetical protein
MTVATQQNLAQQTIPTPAYDDAEASENGSLNNCRPATLSAASTDQVEDQIIRPAPRDEPIALTGQIFELVCYVERRTDPQGYYIGEDYYPVHSALQPKVRQPLRLVKFHGCWSNSGKCFICPQKKDIPGRRPNSWNASLAKALDTPAGQWLKIWSDSLTEQYQYELVPPAVEGNPDYPEFQQDLEKALKPNIIDRLDHPILQKAQQGNDAGEEEEIY